MRRGSDAFSWGAINELRNEELSICLPVHPYFASSSSNVAKTPAKRAMFGKSKGRF